uniref:Large ribosomal subunit protein bL20c n=1 Tax=Marsupiomonas sp. NIES 1824 TaxID=1562198 RepID=A0A097KLV5_9CHLO|nr:ribosomal protein L20 [Marsupiomonas sp. NIES 1824]
MTRVKRGFVAKRRRKKILDRTEGFIGSSSTLFRTANQRYTKALTFSSRDRKNRKRDFRALWITRLNAAANEHQMNYSELISLCKQKNIILNRKVLSQLAIRDSDSFDLFMKELT